MAQIVVGAGTSHTPMLNAAVEDWPKFIELDRLRAHRDKDGRPVTYEELLRLASPAIAGELTPDVLQRRHAQALGEVDRLGKVLLGARLDAIVVVGDDQKELYHDDNMPSILVYRGATIRNVPLKSRPGPEWARLASARYYEASEPFDYPVDAGLSTHIVQSLVQEGFDIACANALPESAGEGHAFAFVHTRLLARTPIPVVPVFLNTYFPPNQPTPLRCLQLGRALRRAVQAWPREYRVGVIASGGLSHFTVDEELDGQITQALRERNLEALTRLPLNKLEAGSSEIRNWICMAGAVEHLDLKHLAYLPAYRTPAGTGTGLCFAHWH